MKDMKAYRAMVHFLEERNTRLPSDEMGSLLGDLSLNVWADGCPADPAVEVEWESALERAEHDTLQISQADASVMRKAS